jgi:peptidoglycan/LPS O-acetylase OafA/YrhL
LIAMIRHPFTRSAHPSPATLPGEARYLTLDVLRGIAAVVVVLYHEAAPNIFHLGGWAPRFSFLAVDLFFCLSGFVLAINYDAKFAGGLTTAAFMKRRLYRLAPLYLLGWLLSLATLVLPGARGGASAALFLPSLLPNLVLLPGTASILFPLNPPSWSLFLELWIANLIYALAWRWLRPSVLAGIVVGAVAGLVFVAVHRHQGFDVGFDWPTMAGGCLRVLLSFFGGVALARLHRWRPAPIRMPAAALCAGLMILFSLPVTGRLVTPYQLFCITIGFPALIYLGARARERGSALGTALGDASYAAYVIHWPLLEFIAWGRRTSPIAIGAGLPLQLTLGLLVIIVSLGLHHGMDAPIRRALRGRTVGHD